MIKENRSIFKNRPSVKALAFFVSGIVFSTILELHYLYSFIPFLIFLIASLYFYLKKDSKPAGLSICLMLFFLGWFRADLAGGPFPPNHIEHLATTGGKSIIYGKIAEEPDIREDRTYLVIEADSVSIRNYTIPSFGRLRAKVLNGGARFDHSDYIMAEGYLYGPGGARNPGGFDYAQYLRTKNIFAAVSVSGPHNVSIIKKGSSFLSSVVKPVRGYMIDVARENLSPVSAAILSGFILGERRDIPEEYQTMFRDTGTLHLMAVSGSNVGLVLTVIAIPLALLGLRRKYKIVILLVAVVFFAILTRLEASVIRASIMASVGLLAYGWLRKPDYINLLGFAGLIMLLWRPLQLFDVGLQLSFAATFGIVYVVPDIYRRIKPLTRKKLRWVRWVVIMIVTTVAAQAAVMPLMALYFNRFPLIGIVANLPVGILASFASSLGIAFYFVSFAGGWLEYLSGRIVEFVLEAVKAILRFFYDLPLAVTQTPSFDWPVIFLYWISIYLFYELLFKRRFSARSLIGVLICFNFIIWPKVFEKKPLWSVEFIDIGLNRAWIYTDEGGRRLGCFDIYREDSYVENTLISSILDFHGERLDWLVTSTPGSKSLKSIKESFSPMTLNLENTSQNGENAGLASDKKYSRLPDGIKIVWGQSDNTERGSHILPCMRIDTGEYYLIMAGRSGTPSMRNIQDNKRIALLELPWGEYARTDCRRTIDRLNPECVVFSPDRYSRGAPRRRSDLTHSADRLLATSICGGFRVAEIGGGLRIETMESVEIEE
ncbi:MAG: ComEC/Rec2 family competence protein [Candidatus Zixiibacteriota bacterium]|nr:MAG: ComEC/Rec2 family competence protein [candidate division Zixibacteria bacterium]